MQGCNEAVSKIFLWLQELLNYQHICKDRDIGCLNGIQSARNLHFTKYMFFL